MGDVRITSNNQSGGITAQNVTTEGAGPVVQDAKRSPWAKLGVFVVGTATVLAAVFGAIELFQ